MRNCFILISNARGRLWMKVYDKLQTIAALFLTFNTTNILSFFSGKKSLVIALLEISFQT